VEVLVDAPAATVRERIGRWSTVEEVDAEHCRVRMTADFMGLAERPRVDETG
jgi:hypothetical protein